jgi:hypothetical protein
MHPGNYEYSSGASAVFQLEAGIYTMMQQLIHKAQLSQKRLLTGAATPCLPYRLRDGTDASTSQLSNITYISDNQLFRLGTAAGVAAQGLV